MHANATARRGGASASPFLKITIMNWREGYDYPIDDDEQEEDFFERADHDYEQQNDK